MPSGHKVYLSVGHDEYWSKAQRDNVETARANGMHLAFFSGNECFWKTRWENDSNGQKRILVCYKETYSGRKIDPTNIWTGTWRDPLGANYDAGKPENALTGTLFTVNGMRWDNITVPAQHRRMRLWRSTPISRQPAADPPSVLADYTLGFEWDEDLDNGSRPARAIQCSSTTYEVANQHLADPMAGLNNGDPGTNFTSGSASHSVMLYKHDSGALVFGAGTTRWSWGLDACHDAGDIAGSPPTTDLNLQQATLNLLIDMGVQPETPANDLVITPKSQDTQPPVTVITSPASGATVTQNDVVLITGTSADAAGIVGGVEVSVDGGTEWHRAQPAQNSPGLESWCYNWIPTAPGPVAIKARAVDDSLNQENPGASINVTVNATAWQSFWSNGAIPSTVNVNDPSPIELGLRFQSSQAGKILGVRFFKGPSNTGTHVGTLWDENGNKLAQVHFNGETASGWQAALFPSPVEVSANTTYVVSYHTSGFYSADRNFFASDFTSGPLTAMAAQNDVYLYGSGGFPTNSYQATNYWVDVVFE